MSGTRAGSGSRARPRGPQQQQQQQRRAQPGNRQRERADTPEHPLLATAHIALGITLSCLIGAAVFGVLIGLVVLVLYLTK